MKLDLVEVIVRLMFFRYQQLQDYRTMDFVTSQTNHVMISPFMDTTSWKIWTQHVMSTEKRFFFPIFSATFLKILCFISISKHSLYSD